MSGVEETPQSGGRDAAADPAALSLSLASAGRAKAEAFLEDQRRLIDDQRAMLQLQMEEIHQRHRYDLSHLRLRRFNGWARSAFELSLGLIGLALAAGLGVMVWNAAHSEGYVIESFAVPPDLAARGLTGEVVAARLLDRLNVVQTPPPNTVRAAQTLSTSASEEVRVEIPQTGISLGELYRFLRRWLGRETHVSGEVVRQDKDVAVAVRINGRDGAVHQGPEAAFDALLLKAAEHVYGTATPTFYANYLMSQNRQAEAQAIREKVLADPSMTSQQRATIWNAMGVNATGRGDLRQSLVLYRRAQDADPSMPLPSTNTILNLATLSQPEAAFALLPRALKLFEDGSATYTAEAVTAIRALMDTQDAELRGDYARAVAMGQAAAAALGGGYRQYNTILNIAENRARQHDGGALAWLADQPRPAFLPMGIRRGLLATQLRMQTALQHWPQVIAQAADAEKIMLQWEYSQTGRELITAVVLRPRLALAKAKTGDVAAAERLIAATPADCYDCIRTRGLIAAEAQQWARADFWFARAVQDAPSIPFAHEDWGRSLLARGDADAAIAQFTLANRKGPNFADAIEGWGEALMAKNQSHLALAKFAAVEKLAPSWGRLHLKWGQALIHAGKPDEAKAKFARALQLDLTPSEKAELARQP